jgi:Glycosyl hydrolase family 46
MLISSIAILAVSLAPAIAGYSKSFPDDIPARSSMTTFPYCQGQTYNISEANCAKFQFDPNDTSNCIEPKNCTTFYDISDFKSYSWSNKIVQFAELITNVFENGDTVIGYAYVQALGDGRGYTCGYIGFTTGTNDANYVVKEYIKRYQEKNSFTKYAKELQRLSDLPFCGNRDARNDTSGLMGFPTVWSTQSCKDPGFVETQLDVGHGMYVEPAKRFAAQWDVKTPLGFALFYDAIIQHGWQYTEPTINLPRILLLTGPRSSFKTEESFLNAFLKTRRQLLCCYPDDTWPPSADRVADLQDLMANFDENKELSKPVTLKRYGVTVNGDEQIVYDTDECGTSSIPSGWELPSATTWALPTGCSSKSALPTCSSK